MRQLFFIILFALSTNSLLGQSNSTVSLSQVTPEGGVTYGAILCIGEDEMGFIWFGSNDGLFRYNSKEIKRYSHFQNDRTSLPTNRINEIYKDKNEKLWIATENGLCSYNPKGDNFENYVIKSQTGDLIGKNIHSFFQDDNGIFWFADELGFGTVNPEDGKAVYQSITNKNITINSISVRKLYYDEKGCFWVFLSDGDIYYRQKGYTTFNYLSKCKPVGIRSVIIDEQNIWIGYLRDGLHCLNLDGTEKQYYNKENEVETKLPSNQIRSIVKNSDKRIWVGTYQGLVLIEDYKVISIEDQDKHSELPNHSIWSLFKDSQNKIWMGTYFGGLCFHSEYNRPFLHYTKSAPNSALSNNVVSSFAQVPEKSEIIVGTEDGLLNYFNMETNKFRSVAVFNNGRAIENIKSLCYDMDGTLWLGTYGDGVFYQKKNEERFSKITPPEPMGFQALDLLATKEGLWISNYPYGVCFYNFITEKNTMYRHDPFDVNSISDDNVRQIIQDKKGNIWFATRNGLNVLKPGTDVFTDYYFTENDSNSIASNIIYSIHADDDGFVWLGTNGQGLDKFDPETGIAIHYTMKDGLPGNEIFSILQGNDDNLWITTNNGLCMFNPYSGDVKSFNSANGIYNNRFNPNSAIAGSNGELFFGGTNGFIRFRPEELRLNPEPPTTIVNDFYVNNRKVFPEDGTDILEEVIGKTNSLKLHYQQNSLAFRFVTNNYIESDKNRIKYRMIGFDDDWVEIDYYGIANFPKLPPGKYTLEVKAANNDGVWNEKPTELAIRIIPPFWFRWYASISYSILVVLTVLYFRQQLINRQKLKNQIELDKVIRENEDYLHQMKLQFFTNISHEFRTPLTLIQGPVNRILKSENENPSTVKQLELVKNNTNRLLRLINQFLDFRKIDSGKLELKPVQTDIISFCANIVACFNEHAKNRGFEFEFKTTISNLKMDFDPDKLDKILFNLLSNAFKSTSDGGSIIVELRSNRKSIPSAGSYTFGDNVESDFVEISVQDNGKGISSHNLPYIFERFYRTGADNQPGTGIGLSLTKNYILLHKGQLNVSSKTNKGTIFTFSIPQNQSGTLIEKQSIDSLASKQADYSEEPYSSTMAKDNSKHKIANQEALILIAEDNSELLNYLGDLLQDHFRVAKAGNGKIALEQAHSLFPDLVISDIMMPEMDGIELCENLKNDIRTSHIPLILLTALDTIKDRISGLQSGADAYLPKPFDDDLLVAQINNLLESRNVLQKSFSSNEIKWEDNFNALDLDKKLILKAIRFVEENMTNIDLTVEHLAENLNLSRTHLHRKLKALTSQSATEFIRYIRLKRAVKLLQEGNHKVNEVGYAVGFNSHNYFTKSFKKQYGKSPSEFLRENSDIANKQSSI